MNGRVGDMFSTQPSREHDPAEVTPFAEDTRYLLQGLHCTNFVAVLTPRPTVFY